MKLVHVGTLRNPLDYTQAQLEDAVRVAAWLGRGSFVLLTEPDGTRS